MNISSFKAFALKPRKLANTFWLWGVLYPWLFVVMVFLFIIQDAQLSDVFWDTLRSVMGCEYYGYCRNEYEDYIFSFFITLFTIEVFFALFLTFRASKSIGTCILQLLVSIFPLFIIFSLIAMGDV